MPTCWEWQTIWEVLTDHAGSKVHVYGMVPGFFLSAYVVGIRREEAVWKKSTVVEPRPGNLLSAHGVVVTEFGPVPVSWTRTGEGAMSDTWRAKPEMSFGPRDTARERQFCSSRSKKLCDVTRVILRPQVLKPARTTSRILHVHIQAVSCVGEQMQLPTGGDPRRHQLFDEKRMHAGPLGLPLRR
jgi:hypothetical protein